MDVKGSPQDENSTDITKTKTKTTRDVIFREFHPIWFISFMGTGIAAAVLYDFAYPAQWLRICGYIMWAISLCLFFLTTSVIIGKVAMYPEDVGDLFTNPTICVFFGAYSMGWSTVVNMSHLVSDGKWAIGIWVLWWINVVLALLCGWGLVFVMLTKSKITEQGIQGVLILPVLPLTVCAASGSLIVQTLPSANLQMITIVITLMLWSNSICLGFCVVTIYFWRLYLYKLPVPEMRFTTWVPIGLFAQGSWGIINNGLNVKNYMNVYSQYEYRIMMGEISHAISFLLGIFLISFGIFLSALAVWTCIYRGPASFTKAWWSMTFPIGAMAVCCNAFQSSFEGFGAFRVISAIYGIICIFSVITCLLGSLFNEFPRQVLQSKVRA